MIRLYQIIQKITTLLLISVRFCKKKIEKKTYGNPYAFLSLFAFYAAPPSLPAKLAKYAS